MSDDNKEDEYEFFTGFPPFTEAKQAVPVIKSHKTKSQISEGVSRQRPSDTQAKTRFKSTPKSVTKRQEITMTPKFGTLGKCDGDILTVCFSPDGKTVVSGSTDGTIRLWDVQTGNMHILGTCEASIESVTYSPKGKMIGSGSADGKIRLWDMQTGKMRVLEKDFFAKSLAFSPLGVNIAAADSTTIKIWNTQTGSSRIIGKHKEGDEISSIAYSPKENYIVSGGHQGSLNLWDARKGFIHELNIEVKEDDFDLLCTIDPFVSEQSDVTEEVRVEHEFIYGYYPSFNGYRTIYSTAFSSDGKNLAAGNARGEVNFYDIATGQGRNIGQLLHNFLYADFESFKGDPYDVICSVAFSPDGKSIASGDSGHHVRVWDIETGKMRVLGESQSIIRAVAFSSDGRTIASGGSDKTVDLWNANPESLNIPEYIVWHTAEHGKNGVDFDTSAAWIDKYHKKLGWKGIGYHYVIRKDGTIEKGRKETDIGAHVKGLNSRSLGICFSGHGGISPHTEAQIETGLRLTLNLMWKYFVPVDNVIGHREINRLIKQRMLSPQFATKKSCPGKLIDMDKVRDSLSEPGILKLTECT